MAAFSATGKTLRMLPGTYTNQLDLRFSTPNPVKIVATGATISTIGDTHAIAVAGGVMVEIRNLSSIS